MTEAAVRYALGQEEGELVHAYSLDLRKRVLAACDVGKASRVVAQQYQVSRAWVDQLKRRETGELGPWRP